MLSSQYNSHLIPAWLRKSVPHEEKESDSCGCNPRRLRPAGCWMCAARRWGLCVVSLAVPPCEEAAPDLLFHQSLGSKKHTGGGKRAATPAPPKPVTLLHLDLSQDTPKARE